MLIGMALLALGVLTAAGRARSHVGWRSSDSASASRW
jgi:hypothetical protein